MVPMTMERTPMITSFPIFSPWVIRRMPTPKRAAPLLRMRMLAARSLPSRLARLWEGSSQRGAAAMEDWQRGQVSRVFTTADPQFGHLRVRAIRVNLGGIRAPSQRCIFCGYAKVIHNPV